MKRLVLTAALLLGALSATARSDVLPSPGNLDEGRDKIIGLWMIEDSRVTGRNASTIVLAIGNDTIAQIDYMAEFGEVLDEEKGVSTDRAVSNFYVTGRASRPYSVVSASDDVVLISVKDDAGADIPIAIQVGDDDNIRIESAEPYAGGNPLIPRFKVYTYVRLKPWLPGMTEFPERAP